ncbi:hypothetical protein [Amycolatopsis suaedae]|uniref:Uncharacterized protein n=1 Tax=Amycolatopsis suaedae TaxID=2510978 RepID=A0A4Q7J9X8_9PSEU|nr:hypothetical protein [Amycolatopsis suaedae]RZQ63818.1 hypothetical protein EWH70_11690 [Amycolatopsis suaedae]
MMTTPVRQGRWSDAITALNTRWHKLALYGFLVIVVAHWAEHIAQAIQIYALGWPVPQARGVLGIPFPWLVSSEWMHYGYAVVMLFGLVVLRHGFHGRSGRWWRIAMWIQVWHHFEHLLLLLQALTGSNILGKPAPTSIIQLVIPRVELHLVYNAIVFVPMLVGMLLHQRPRAAERERMSCACALAAAR